MDVSSQGDDRRIIEGWLYIVRSNKFGFRYPRKRYYVLQNRHLKSFNSIPHSLNEDPIGSAAIDSYIHVMDNGRKSIRGKVFFIFTLSGISSNGGRVKLGARSPEEAARWIESFSKVSLKINQNPGDILDCVKYEQQYLRSNNSGRVHDTNYVDNTRSLATFTDPKNGDVSLNWAIFGCQNGLRLFKEARNQEGQNKQRDDHPALSAMSVIDGAPEVVFHMLMSLGSSRSEWDFCFQKGDVIENIDTHTDIIHKLLNDHWLPWGMKRRDLLLQRHWQREDDGTYIIRYHSIRHKKCPPQNGYVRARLKSGGYVISPVKQHKKSVVRHMLAIDWKLWRSYMRKSSSQSLSIHMLGRVAALREFFKTNIADYLCEFSMRESKIEGLLHQSETSMSVYGNGEFEALSDHSSHVETEDESDEFFDLPEMDEPGFSPEIYSQDLRQHVNAYTPPANVLAKKLHEYTVTRKGCADLEGSDWEVGVSYNYKITLPGDRTGNSPNSWSVPEPSLFQIRGETYLEDSKKITAKTTLMQTVAVDWLRSDKQEDNLAGRPQSIVQKFAAEGRPEFFFVVNFQIPGSTTYNIASYYMTNTPVKDLPLLHKFIQGDDAFRNSRFKLISHISKGPWLLRQSVNRASLVGHLLNINYVRGNNYIELDIEVGSSALARGVASNCFSCFSNLIAETAFVIQANTQDELPEHLYGACRLNHLDISKAFWANP